MSHCVISCHCHTICNYTPGFNEVESGVYWFHLVRLSLRPSVCGQNRARSVSPILAGSIWYLHILSSNIRMFVACEVFFSQNFEVLANSLNLWHWLWLFWFGIHCESIIWVILGRRGYPQNAGIAVGTVSTYSCRCQTVCNDLSLPHYGVFFVIFTIRELHILSLWHYICR